MSYMFPEMRSVREKPIEWHVCKLAEEAGEVAECICKNRPVDDLADEVMDVMQVCENILRKIGEMENVHEIDDEIYDCLVDSHIDYEYDRNYYVLEGK